jgi:hypothetical protein
MHATKLVLALVAATLAVTLLASGGGVPNASAADLCGADYILRDTLYIYDGVGDRVGKVNISRNDAGKRCAITYRLGKYEGQLGYTRVGIQNYPSGGDSTGVIVADDTSNYYSYAGPVKASVTRCFNIYGFVAATPSSKRYSVNRYACT